MKTAFNKIKKYNKRLYFKNLYVVTSSIASGKSTFLKIAKEENIPCINADIIAARVFGYKKKRIIKKLNIKNQIKNNKNIINIKQAVSNVIFNDKKAKKKLEKIMHSRIKKEIIKKIKLQHNKLCFVEIPLFFENLNYTFILNKIIIYCPYEESLKRLMVRNKIDKIKAQKILDSQMSVEKKSQFATYLLKNTTNVDDFITKSRDLIQKIRSKNVI